MPRETDSLDKLAQKFNYDTDHYDVGDIPDEIVAAMKYIDENTGLLGDYNTGIVQLVEGGQKIQWYSRGGRYFSEHDTLLHWIQQEAEEIFLGTAGMREHPDDEKQRPYAEIHPISRWGYDDDE